MRSQSYTQLALHGARIQTSFIALHVGNLFLQNSGGIQFGGNFNGFGGSLDLDIGSLKIDSRSSNNFGSRVTSFNIGTERSPVPITLKLIPISDALRQEYWSQLERTSKSYRRLKIAAKRANLMRALEDYADYVGATELKGSINIV